MKFAREANGLNERIRRNEETGHRAILYPRDRMDEEQLSSPIHDSERVRE